MIPTLGVEPWHWALSGVVLGLITLTLLYLANKRLGISTGLEDACAIVSRAPYFQRREIVQSGGWRLWFIGGLLLGGVGSAWAAGSWSPSWSVPLLDSMVSWDALHKLAWMFAGGLCIGFGTRLAGGCTSGHGIFGIANFEASSWVSTGSFLIAAILFANVFVRVVGS